MVKGVKNLLPFLVFILTIFYFYVIIYLIILKGAIKMKYNGIKFDKNKAPKTYNYVCKRIYKTIRCNRCGCPVLKSDVKGYSYQCLNCDEDLYKIETHKGKPYTEEEFNEICLMTQDLLLLDN